MPLFFHDLYLFGDQDAAGIWRAEHQAEHTQFVVTLLNASPIKSVADFDLVSWEETRPFITRWLTQHEAVHEQLRFFTGVSGVNLADVDFSQQGEFYDWLDVHRNEHVLLRQALGIT
jgi:hypothetical protein